jgi:1-acyl-sn-glycerol-3-phosphate acyltransferase
VTKWKTGFYRVAVAAQVPILPVALDYAQKAVVIGTPLMPSGDYVADERQLRAHFHAGQAKYPHRY